MACLDSSLQNIECAVCGEKRGRGETWFIVTESHWEDRASVWKWNQQMALDEMAHPVCSQQHVRELIVHWMTTGCLHYPFATVPFRSSYKSLRRLNFSSASFEDESPRTLLGELSVDREGIARVLRENPLSLNAVLDELTIALENEVPDVDEAERDDEPFFAMRTV